jgi:hypothetical protein
MSGHTPGPLGFHDNFLTVFQIYRAPLGTNAVAKCLTERDGGGCSAPREEAIANGHLFAAAPEMYAALKAFVEDWTELGGKVRGSTLDSIDAAIAKAEGRT